MKTADSIDLSTLTVDYPGIRLDEHDRACPWCAAHSERCLRGQALVQALKEMRLNWDEDC